MVDPRDIVEIGGRVVNEGAAVGAPGSQEARDGSAVRPRAFLQLWFRCANQYGRAMKTADGTAYIGRCPKCGAEARFGVGSGGTNRRVFEMSCV